MQNEKEWCELWIARQGLDKNRVQGPGDHAIDGVDQTQYPLVFRDSMGAQYYSAIHSTADTLMRLPTMMC